MTESDTKSPPLMSKKSIPAHSIWRIMRGSTCRAISSEAVREVQIYIENFILSTTQAADKLLMEWNAKLPKNLQRQRIGREIMAEVLNHGNK